MHIIFRVEACAGRNIDILRFMFEKEIMLASKNEVIA